MKKIAFLVCLLFSATFTASAQQTETSVEELPIGSYEIIVSSYKLIPESLPNELKLDINEQRMSDMHTELVTDTLTVRIMSQQAYDEGMRWLPYTVRKEAKK